MTRARVAAGLAVAGIGVALLVLAVAALVDGTDRDGRTGTAATAPTTRAPRVAGIGFDDARPAGGSFGAAGFTEARLRLGRACLRVVVADDDAERVRGLRGVRDLGRYDGMLFVFSDDVRAEFTMADTLIPLDIGFYDDAGRRVDRRRMVPCPDGDDTTCPRYAASAAYRAALEVPAGELGPGALAPCA